MLTFDQLNFVVVVVVVGGRSSSTHSDLSKIFSHRHEQIE